MIYTLKKALEPFLPSDILYRPKKGPGALFRHSKLDLPNVGDWDLLDPRFDSREIADERANRSDGRGFLWNAWPLKESEAGRSLRTAAGA